MSQFYNNAVFWVEVDKIKPNPYQPRREFDELQLKSLSESIRQYGVLQALVVTRKEVVKADGGLTTEYELIAGERRLRASKLAGLREVPVLIKAGEEDDRLKLELAIIENVQREDLNPIDRARAFQRLADEFGMKHIQIAEKVGKSREYVSNSMRLLSLPTEMITSLEQGKISEGHARPLMMLNSRPEEQAVLFKEIIFKKLTVREAEAISRRVAYDRVRKKEHMVDPEIVEMEEKLTETLGTRVHIERGQAGGKITIDFFSPEDLRSIIESIKTPGVPGTVTAPKAASTMLDAHIANGAKPAAELPPETHPDLLTPKETAEILDDRSIEEKKKDEDEMYSIKNFSL